jgi:hypothetical protein
MDDASKMSVRMRARVCDQPNITAGPQQVKQPPAQREGRNPLLRAWGSSV